MRLQPGLGFCFKTVFSCLQHTFPPKKQHAWAPSLLLLHCTLHREIFHSAFQNRRTSFMPGCVVGEKIQYLRRSFAWRQRRLLPLLAAGPSGGHVLGTSADGPQVGDQAAGQGTCSLSHGLRAEPALPSLSSHLSIRAISLRVIHRVKSCPAAHYPG